MERRCYGLDVKHTKTMTGKDFWYIMNDDGSINQPVFEYLKNLSMRNDSKNTIRNNCYYLKEWFEWLELKGFDYIEVVGKKSSTNKGAYNNLTDYRLYLTYGNYDLNIIPISGLKQIRKDSYVNQMMSSVLTFYQYLEATGTVGNLPVFTQRTQLMHSNSMLREMFIHKKQQHKSIFSTKTEKEPLRFVSEEDFELCWKKCTCRRNRIIIGLMYYAALRLSEVIGLNLTDLRDIYQNIIYVKKRNDLNNPDAFVKYNSERTIVIDDRLRDEIIFYMNEDLQGIDTNYLIINFRGSNKYGPMKADTIRDMIDELNKKVKFEKLHPHMFRHGAAMRLLYAGIDMATISAILGHKSPETTANTYAKYDLRMKQKVQKELSEKLKTDYAPLNINLENLAKLLQEDEEDE